MIVLHNWSSAQDFQARLSSSENKLVLSLEPKGGDFIDLEFGQVEFFIRTSSDSEASISRLVVNNEAFPGNLPLFLISDELKGEYRVFHFGYSLSPSIVKKSYYAGSSYILAELELSNVSDGELFELVHDAETYETYLNLTSSKGEDLGGLLGGEEEEALGMFTGEMKRKQGSVHSQGTRISLTDKENDVALFSSNNVDVSVYPNPVVDRVELTIEANEAAADLEVQVQDLNGKQMLVKQLEVVKGVNQLGFNLAPFTAGTYFIVANGETIQFSHKVQLQK